MNDKNVAIWCMLNLSLRDSLKQSLDVDTLLLERMMNYYEETNQSKVMPRAGLYYGRTLALDGNCEKAVRIYLAALENAESIKDYNLAGYISSYIADLYSDEYESQLAREYYLKAEKYFAKVNNLRSQAIAYRDVSYTYSIDGNYDKALSWILKADSMSVSMNDSILRSSLLNYLGNIYMRMGNNDLAETNFLNSMALSEDTKSANYLSMMDLYLSMKQYDKIYDILDLVSALQLSIEEEATSYKYCYLVEKEKGNYKLALKYYEKGIIRADSIWAQNHSRELVEIKQKYGQEHLVNVNNKLEIERQRIIILLAVLILVIIVLIAFVWIGINRRKLLKQKILLEKQETNRQRLETENKEIALRAKENEILELKRYLEFIKNSLIERSSMYERMQMLSGLPINSEKRELELDKIMKEMFSQPFLSGKDWMQIKDLIDKLYPTYAAALSVNESLSDDELDYCYLVRFGFPSSKVIILLNITKTTLKSKRHRIMRKLGLTNQNLKLEDFLASLV